MRLASTDRAFRKAVLFFALLLGSVSHASTKAQQKQQVQKQTFEIRGKDYTAHYYDPRKIDTYAKLSQGILHVSGLTERIIEAVKDFGRNLEVSNISAPPGERSVVVTVHRPGFRTRGHTVVIPIRSITYASDVDLSSDVMPHLEEVELDWNHISMAPFSRPTYPIRLAPVQFAN